MALMYTRWVNAHCNIPINDPIGVGKAYLACAIANQTCRYRYTALYCCLTQLFPTLTKAEVLLLDDWSLAPMMPEVPQVLLEILDDRDATILISQLPLEHWYDAIGDAT